jgi:hypothetical protein
MKSTVRNTRTPAYYTVREAAWILGDSSKVWRAIRTGALPTTRRRSRLVVPAYALARLLGDRSDGGEA